MQHYKTFLLELFAARNIIARATDIEAGLHYQEISINEIEALDKDITCYMIAAEKKCGRKWPDQPWYLEPMELRMWFRYWWLHEKAIINNRFYNIPIQKLEERIECAGLKPNLNLRGICDEKQRAKNNLLNGIKNAASL